MGIESLPQKTVLALILKIYENESTITSTRRHDFGNMQLQKPFDSHTFHYRHSTNHHTTLRQYIHRPPNLDHIQPRHGICGQVSNRIPLSHTHRHDIQKLYRHGVYHYHTTTRKTTSDKPKISSCRTMFDTLF